MDAKTHYQKYWNSKRRLEEFMAYERNWVLPDLFRNSTESVLDLGCGDGAVAEYLSKNFHLSVTGADISPQAIKQAKNRGVDTVLLDAEKGLPFKSQEFDAVWWGDNVEHLFDPQEVLKEIARVLNKDGRLIMSCPNMAYWRYRLYYFLRGKLPDTEWTGFKPWAWSHIRFFNLQILKEFLASEGFHITNVIGVNRRFPDSFLVKLFPSLFGMIFVLEAKK